MLMIDNVMVLDNVLTDEQCNLLISDSQGNLNTEDLETDLGYEYFICLYEKYPFLIDTTQYIVREYEKQFPSINKTATIWDMADWKLKHFPPGYHFSPWHHEHDYRVPHRIACIILYLTDHNCGTQFFSTKEVIKSVKGRAVMFPTFWTHTHRGQVCPDNKDRYIMSAYALLTDLEMKEGIPVKKTNWVIKD